MQYCDYCGGPANIEVPTKVISNGKPVSLYFCSEEHHEEYIKALRDFYRKRQNTWVN